MNIFSFIYLLAFSCIVVVINLITFYMSYVYTLQDKTLLYKHSQQIKEYLSYFIFISGKIDKII